MTTEKNAGISKKGGDHTKEHEELLRYTLVKLSESGYLAWNNRTGALKRQSGGFQKYGLKGSADIIAIQPGTGIFCGFEIKTGNAVQNKQQKAFEKAVIKRNGLYKIIRTQKDINEFLAIH